MTRPFKTRPNPTIRFAIGLFFSMALMIFGGMIIGALSIKCTCICPNANQIETNIKLPPDTIHLDRATTYQATIEQCDSTPFSTASGAKINPDYYQKWVAISRDLHTRYGGEFNFGDTLEIYSKEHPNLNGQWVVQDLMAPSYKMSIDFLLEPEKNYPKLGIGTDVKIIMCSDQY